MAWIMHRSVAGQAASSTLVNELVVRHEAPTAGVVETESPFPPEMQSAVPAHAIVPRGLALTGDVCHGPLGGPVLTIMLPTRSPARHRPVEGQSIAWIESPSGFTTLVACQVAAPPVGSVEA